MSKNTGVLAHYQERSARPTDFIPADVADVMVQRMAAERISRRVVRMLSPDSVFLPARDFRQTRNVEETPLNLGPLELPGLRVLRQNPWAFAATRRADAMAAVGQYVWG